MSRAPLSIRNILMLTIGALSMLVAIFTLQQVFQQWQQLQKIRALQSAMILGDKLFDATETLSVERDVSFFALDAVDPAMAADLTTDMKDARAAAGTSFADTILAMQRYNFGEMGPSLKLLYLHERNLEQLRQEVDRNLALPDREREPKFPDKWFQDTTALILETRALWMNFIGHFDDVDPAVAMQIRLKYFLGMITEYTGQQRATIGHLLVRNRAASQQETANLLRWQGKVELSWATADQLGTLARLYPAIQPAYKDARSQYANLFDMMKNIFYVPGPNVKPPYPISVDFWLELSTEATDSLYTFKTAALKASQTYVQGLEESAVAAIILRLAVLLSSLGLCFYSFRIVTTRVLKPIQELVDALLSTSEGKQVVSLPISFDRQDEIGKLGRVLRSFQKTLVNMKRYNRDLERSNRELNDFAYIASHDLKEPLRGIHNHSRFLLEDNRGKLDAESLKRIDRLLYLSQRIERLVSDLLYFSRLGRQELAVQPTDINAVIHDIESTLDVFLEQNHAQIKIKDMLPTIVCDGTRVTEVFRNLIVNAIKYNDSETKIVEIGYIPVYHHAGHEIHDVFFVKDNGRGIPQQFHEEIFRIFRRLEKPTVPGEGTGVGLTFVKKIIERHEGIIWLDSQPGKGTIFYFTLHEEEGDKSDRQEVA